jgi:hypothetical protein
VREERKRRKRKRKRRRRRRERERERVPHIRAILVIQVIKTTIII